MAGNKPFNKQQAEPRERDPQVAGLKVPPHSIEAEQSVLGGLMLDNERWDDVAERVVADDFYTRPHRHIFTEMARLQESGSPIDLITLAESLERQGNLIASVVSLIWRSCQKIRQVRRTSVLMLTSCVNVPLFAR